MIKTRTTAEKDGIRHTARRAPAIRSEGVRIPARRQLRTRPSQFAHFQNPTIPAAPMTATTGVALKRKRAAVQDMYVAVKIHTANTSEIWLR